MAKTKHADKTATNDEKTNVNETAQATTQAQVNDEPTSEKLTELRSQRTEALKNAMAAEIDSKEQQDGLLEVWKLDAAIKSEIAALNKQKIQAELDEKRNARIKLFNDAIAADRAAQLDPDNAELADAAAKTAEIVKNELLARYSSAAPAKKATSGNSNGGTRGAISAAIRALIVPMFAEGKTGAEVRHAVIHDNGFNDGTANAVIKKYEEEIGLK